MSYEVSVRGGGVFSIMHQFFEVVLENVENIDTIEEVNMIVDHGAIKDQHMFDNVFKVGSCENKIKIASKHTKNSFLQANLFERIDNLKKISKKMKYNDFILGKVDEFVEKYKIDNCTLGVHVRVTDMNNVHPEYGFVDTNRFVSETKKFLNENKNITKIFLASDNTESINVFIEEFPDIEIIFYEGIRVEKNTDNNFRFQIENMKDKNFFVSNFIENLILSKCCALIHRISDFANYAIINAENFGEVICIK